MSIPSLRLMVLSAAGHPAAEDARPPKSEADLRLWLGNMVYEGEDIDNELRRIEGVGRRR